MYRDFWRPHVGAAILFVGALGAVAVPSYPTEIIEG